VFNIHN